MYRGLVWLIIMGSEFGDWAYWHFFTITSNYNSSHTELLLHDVCLTNLGLICTNPRVWDCVTTDGQSVSLSRNKHPSVGLGPDSYHCERFACLLMWSALSDERTGLSFTIAASPRQGSHSRVQVPWDSWPYFTISVLWLPFSSPPSTRRVTVEVFDPASTRESSLVPCYDRRSVDQSVLE
jgi:hypothetical protein